MLNIEINMRFSDKIPHDYIFFSTSCLITGVIWQNAFALHTDEHIMAIDK